jgi:pyridoxal phosphate enzyme (YggS family)
MIAKRLTQVQERINRACDRAGRDPAEITLVAVTKTWPVDVLLAAYGAGLRHFGENRSHEIESKRPALEAELGADSGLVWHYIANLQSRQTNAIADLADYFHALDRLKVAQRLERRLADNGRGPLPVLIQVNVSGEASKAGVNCQNWETAVSESQKLQEMATAVAKLPQLKLEGLMTMAPWHAPDAEIEQVFVRTRALRDWLTDALGRDLPALSMGMTDDFELAIASGATHIRVGRAIFGERS